MVYCLGLSFAGPLDFPLRGKSSLGFFGFALPGLYPRGIRARYARKTRPALRQIQVSTHYRLNHCYFWRFLTRLSILAEAA